MVNASGQGMSRRLLLQLAAAGATGLGATHAGGAQAGAAFGVPMTPQQGGPVKTRTTYYTPERVAAARANVAEISWAAQLRDDAVAAAQASLDAGLDWLWHSVTTQGLPRSFAVNQDLGSPITGTDIFEYGNYPWLADPYAQPWKLEDPSSGYVFPTNDFASFYASALDENGNFDRDLGDPQFLVNTAYPDRGPDWGVDDGWGWVDDNGDKWTFCAYYNHWFLWYVPLPVGDHEMTSVRRGLEMLRDAYLYTGDLTYAQHGIVLLDRFADAYPAMDTSVYTVADGYRNSDGGRGRGKAIGSIWETGLVSSLILSYDAFFPALDGSDEAGVVDFLAAKAQEYDLPPKDSVADIRANIENGVLRQIYPAVLEAQIFGNFGMHQNTLARAAVVLDEEESAQEWLDFVFGAGGLVNEGDGNWSVTGGHVGPTLVDDVDRDGWYKEGAPGYNVLPVGNLQGLAETLDGFDTYPAADIAEHPKYLAMVGARPGLTMLARYTPSIGDSGQTGAPMLLRGPDDYVQAFERYGNIIDAQMAYLTNDNTTEGLRGDVFNAGAAGLEERIQEVIDTHGALTLGSENLTGFGFAMHRVGEGAQERALTTFYGTNQMHGHRNALALGMFGHGLDLLPGLGYPEFADNNNRRHEWNSNTVASNTVVVDATPHAAMVVGRPLGYLASDQVQMSDIEATDAYPDLETYRRTSVMVSIDDERWYVLDVFGISGGQEHVFSFHTAEGPATVNGVELTAQDGGTYAGPDVEPPDTNDPPRSGASGFDWLTRVERGAPQGPFSIDWDITDTYGVHDDELDLHLRMTVLEEVDELALADGIPPRNKPGNPESLRFALLRRTGSDLDSRFTSVLEPYVDEPSVAEIRALTVTDAGAQDAGAVTAVEVTLQDGRTDWLIHDPVGDRELLIGDRLTVRGAFAVVRFDADGEPEHAVGHDAQVVSDGSRRLLRTRPITGVIAERTAELETTSTMVVDLDRPLSSGTDLTGQYVYVEDDGERNAVYQIAAARSRGLRLEVDVDTTFVRAYADPEDLDAGYVYDVEVGRTARIPAIQEWNG